MRAALVYAVLAAMVWFGLGWAVEARAQTAALLTVEVTANDGQLRPQRIEVPAGRRIKIKLNNIGRSPIEFENLDLHIEKVLAPGAQSFVVIAPLRPGSYTFVDEFHSATGTMQLIAK